MDFKYLRNNFGLDCLKLCRELEHTARKIANFRNHLRFNLRCLHEDIIPRSVKLKSNIKGHKAENIIRNAERKLLNERSIRQVNFTIDVLNSKYHKTEEKLRSIIPSETYERVLSFIKNTQLTQHSLVKDRRINKFVTLKQSHSRSDLDTQLAK